MTPKCELYPPDDPPRPSRPGPSDDDDDGEVNNEAIVRYVRSSLVSRARTLEMSAILTQNAMEPWYNIFSFSLFLFLPV